MAIWSFLRRIFGNTPVPRAPTEVVVERTEEAREVEVFKDRSSRSVDGATLLVQFSDQLTSQAHSQQQLNSLLGTLTTTLNALPQLARQQGQVLETLLEGAARSRIRDQAIERNLVQLTDGSDRQTQVLGLVQQQLDLNHEVSLRVAESLKETASAISTFAATSDRQSRALENLASATERRVKQADRLEKALQFWLAIVALLCTVALVYAVYSATRGPQLVAVTQEEAARLVAPTPVVAPAQPVVVPPTSLPTLGPATVPGPAPVPVPATAPVTAPVPVPATAPVTAPVPVPAPSELPPPVIVPEPAPAATKP